MKERVPRNSASANLIISIVFHAVVVSLLLFFAAREGMLGEKFKTIAVTMVPKEKPSEKPPEKEPEPVAEPVQAAAEPEPVAAKAPPTVASMAPPPVMTAPSVAPPAAALPGFVFHDGAKAVESSSDPVAIYRGQIEASLRSRWKRGQDGGDEANTAEVELRLDSAGNIVGNRWLKGSGDAAWDNSVRQAVAQTKTVGRPPPKGFPDKLVVRFDVQPVGEELVQ